MRRFIRETRLSVAALALLMPLPALSQYETDAQMRRKEKLEDIQEEIDQLELPGEDVWTDEKGIWDDEPGVWDDEGPIWGPGSEESTVQDVDKPDYNEDTAPFRIMEMQRRQRVDESLQQNAESMSEMQTELGALQQEVDELESQIAAQAAAAKRQPAARPAGEEESRDESGGAVEGEQIEPEAESEPGYEAESSMETTDEQQPSSEDQF